MTRLSGTAFVAGTAALLLACNLFSGLNFGRGPKIDWIYDSDYGEVEFSTNGSRVEGVYYSGEGRLVGTLKNDTIKFHWSETAGGKGTGYFVVKDGGDRLVGRWKFDSDREWIARWECVKQ